MVFVINQGVVANMFDLSMVFTGFSQRKQTLPVDPIEHRFMRVTGTLFNASWRMTMRQLRRVFHPLCRPQGEPR